mmetsp:Transcript_51657/g.112015  ORF Transcript_51657/g.112015 Transcript_51657/m.112015 type:complete len:115 (+) Transcript_51657:425-769(+)
MARVTWTRRVLRSVAAEEQEQSITGPSSRDEPLQASGDVVLSGLQSGRAAVDENTELFVAEVQRVSQHSVNVAHVIDTAFQLSMGADVVAANEESPSPLISFRIPHFEWKRFSC